MSVVDKVTALLASDADPKAINRAASILNQADTDSLIALQDLLKTSFKDASRDSRTSLNWQKLLSTLLSSSKTRNNAFLFAISSIQHGVLPSTSLSRLSEVVLFRVTNRILSASLFGIIWGVQARKLTSFPLCSSSSSSLPWRASSCVSSLQRVNG